MCVVTGNRGNPVVASLVTMVTQAWLTKSHSCILKVDFCREIILYIYRLAALTIYSQIQLWRFYCEVSSIPAVKLARQVSRRPQRDVWFDPSQVGVRFVVDEVAHKHAVAVKFGNRAR
jgi:hypothetical protein